MTWVHDTPLLVTLALAGGFIWSHRRRAALVAVVLLLPASAYWSSLDITGHSAWWRARIVYSKLTGELTYIGWRDVAWAVCSRSYGLAWPHPRVVESVTKVDDKEVGGRKLELYRTDLGDFWIPAPGEDLLRFLIWEMTIQHVYENDGVQIRSGDTVIDVGAHVGVFTRYALSRGAERVVAIEPEPTNLACLEENLAAEIACHRVLLVKAGVWDRKATLPLRLGQSGAHRFEEEPGGPHIDGISLLPLDEVIAQLGLQGVDFIKMDIEGAEIRALRGARETLRRFEPRMAICTYHDARHPVLVPQVIQTVHKDYGVQGRDVETQWYRVRPKVLFFQTAPVE